MYTPTKRDIEIAKWNKGGWLKVKYIGGVKLSEALKSSEKDDKNLLDNGQNKQ